MRICVLQSSFEGSKSVFTAEESMPNPGHYVDPDHHTFEQRYIRKFAEKKDIDGVVAENFDMYWNFMWGQLYDDVSGIEATRYLESKGVRMIGSPADYMAMTKNDLMAVADAAGTFLVPRNTPGRFPKIVKFTDGMASLGMDEKSVCYSQNAIGSKVCSLQQQEPGRSILVQDFITGIETTAIIIEMGSEVVALPPVDWIFQTDVPFDKAWLSYTSKFHDLEAGIINFAFVKDEARRQKICEAGVAAFKALGLQGRGGWGRIDARVDHETGEVYCLEMNHLPAVFFPQNEAMSDDIIIRQTYPGGHEAFIDMMLYTRQYQADNTTHRSDIICRGNNNIEREMTKIDTDQVKNGHHQDGHLDHNDVSSNFDVNIVADGTSDTAGNQPSGLSNATTNGTSENGEPQVKPVQPKSLTEAIGDFKARGITIADVYDSAAESYDQIQAKMAIRQWQIEYFSQYTYHGTVLDLACGTGGIGMLIKKAGNNATIHGIDISPRSLQLEQVRQHYSSTEVGYLQDAIMSAGTFDHIICFGALHFLTRVQFNAAVARMFMLARKSVAFDVDDVSQEYIDKILEAYGEGLRNYNLMKAYKRFGTPPGWKKTVEEERPLFHSPSVQVEVRGIVVRFDRT